MSGAVSVQIRMDAPMAQLEGNLPDLYLGILGVETLTMTLLYLLNTRLVVKPMRGLESWLPKLGKEI